MSPYASGASFAVRLAASLKRTAHSDVLRLTAVLTTWSILACATAFGLWLVLVAFASLS